MSEQNGNETLLDFDQDIDDVELGQIENLPEFINPPTGVYILKVLKADIKTKEDKETKQKKKRIQHLYSIRKVLELAEANELVPETGSLFVENFQWNQEGLKYWKQKARQILGIQDLDKSKLVDVLKELSSEEYLVKARVINQVTNRDGHTYVNSQVRVISQVKVSPEQAAEEVVDEEAMFGSAS